MFTGPGDRSGRHRLGGRGTPNTVPKWITASTLGDSVISNTTEEVIVNLENTNFRLGDGTVSGLRWEVDPTIGLAITPDTTGPPVYSPLQIFPKTGVEASIIYSDNGTYNTEDPPVLFHNSGLFLIEHSDTNTNPTIRFDAGGNIGLIGTTPAEDGFTRSPAIMFRSMEVRGDPAFHDFYIWAKGHDVSTSPVISGSVLVFGSTGGGDFDTAPGVKCMIDENGFFYCQGIGIIGGAASTINAVGGLTLEDTGGTLSFYGASPIAQYATTGTTTGFTAGAGTGARADSTYTGNTGSTAYTTGDIVRALKLLGLIAS